MKFKFRGKIWKQISWEVWHNLPVDERAEFESSYNRIKEKDYFKLIKPSQKTGVEK